MKWRGWAVLFRRFSVLVALVITSCEPPELKEWAPRIAALEKLPLESMVGYSAHYVGEALVFTSQKNDLNVFSVCNATADGGFSLIRKRISVPHGLPVDTNAVWASSEPILKGICQVHAEHGVNRYGTDMAAEKSLVFVFAETQRLQVFLGSRPTSFPYDIMAQRTRLNDRWDLITLKF